jgi:hypothetical protein
MKGLNSSQILRNLFKGEEIKSNGVLNDIPLGLTF